MCCLSECAVLPLGSIRAVSFFQILFACAEALHAHGYSSEASRLTVELAQDLLANPPDLKVEPPPAKVRETPHPSLCVTPNPLPHPPARVSSSLHQAHFFASSLSPPNPSHKHLCLFPALLEPSIALQMQEQIKKGGGGGCCFSGIFLACLGAGAGISVSISTRQVAAGKLLLCLGLHVAVYLLPCLCPLS